MIEAAILGGAALSTGGSIFSSLFGSSAAKQQAAAIRYAADVARQTALELDARARQDLAPFTSLGADARELVGKILRGEVSLEDALGKNSLFAWQRAEGERGINRQLAARGLYGSGAGLETLARFNAQLVGEEGARYWDRLMNVTTLGANAAARVATNTTQTGANLSQMLARTGLANAQSIGDAGRSIAAIGGQIGGLGQTLLQYGIYRPILDRLASGSVAAPVAPAVPTDLKVSQLMQPYNAYAG